MRHLFWGGVHPAGRKELSRGAAPTPAPLPSQVVIPMVQHIGKPCTPLVKMLCQKEIIPMYGCCIQRLKQ